MTAIDVMDRIARVRAALAAEAVDRPPFTVWYHFGLQHLPPERVAEAHVEFADAYDLDWLKVMNDYGYPMPDGLEVATQASDLGTPPAQTSNPTRIYAFATPRTLSIRLPDGRILLCPLGAALPGSLPGAGSPA